MTGLYVGQAIGGFGATAAAAFSWQATFHWFGIVGIAYSLVLILFLKENPIHNVSSKKIDNVPGEKKPSIISGLSLLFTNWAFWIILFYFAAPSAKERDFPSCQSAINDKAEGIYNASLTPIIARSQ